MELRWLEGKIYVHKILFTGGIESHTHEVTDIKFFTKNILKIIKFKDQI